MCEHFGGEIKYTITSIDK